MATKLERDFQHHLINRLSLEFPGCYVLKQDARLRPGIPDLLVLYRRYWAALEVKASPSAYHQPNQDYYNDEMNAMSYAAFVYPENEEEVFDELHRSFKTRRSARLS